MTSSLSHFSYRSGILPAGSSFFFSGALGTWADGSCPKAAPVRPNARTASIAGSLLPRVSFIIVRPPILLVRPFRCGGGTSASVRRRVRLKPGFRVYFK